MAIVQNPSDFLNLVEKAELLEPAQLKPYRERTAGLTIKETAEMLVRDGMITGFQAGLLLKGKWRNFFLGGKYKVLEHLGSGGMGTVFLCEHRHMRRRVAVKLLPPEQLQNQGSLQRFMREAQAVARMDHPNIVRAYDINHDGAVHFLVMEYVDGVSLQQLVETRGPLEVLRSVNYVGQVAAGLQHAYESGLVHRDIKPNNLVIDRTGCVKILDLGLARFTANADNLTRMIDSKTILGTADYLAPEQARDSNVDIRADIYSMGALFYFLLTGKPPFDGGNIAQKLIWHQTKMPAPLDTVRPDVPKPLAAIVTQMMDKDPNKRFATPVELINALSPWIAEVPPPSPDELPVYRYTHHRDVDTNCKLSTVSTITGISRAQLKAAAAGITSDSLAAIKK
jgi:serine/threonine protein kinase